MDQKLRIEMELRKKLFEDRVKHQNEEKARKEQERKAKIDQNKKAEMQKKKLEEMQERNKKLLEEEQRLMMQQQNKQQEVKGKRSKVEENEGQDEEVQDTLINDSQNTQFGYLDDLINDAKTKKDNQEDLMEQLMMNQRTIPQTPLLAEMKDDCYGDIDERARITQLMEASIRTDRTMIIDKEYGKLLEESFSKDVQVVGQQIQILDTVQNPQLANRLIADDLVIQTMPDNQQVVSQRSNNQEITQSKQSIVSSKKDQFLLKMEFESQMRKIQEAQRLKKQKEDEDQMRKKQEILAQVLGVGGMPKQQQQQMRQQESRAVTVLEQSIRDEFEDLREETDDITDESESGITASLNDRDDDDSSAIMHLYQQSIGESSTLHKKIVLNTLQARTEHNPSDTLKYSDEEDVMSFLSESQASQKADQLYQQFKQQQFTEDKKPSRIQSASSKNRQDYYEKYHEDLSVNSKDYDGIYTIKDNKSMISQVTQQRQEGPLDKDISQKILPSADVSYVNIQDSEILPQKSYGKFKPEDLPPELRAYENRVLNQLQLNDDDDTYEDDDYEPIDEPADNQLTTVQRDIQQSMDLMNSKFKVSISSAPQYHNNDIEDDKESSDANDPLKEYYKMMKEKLGIDDDQQQPQPTTDIDDFEKQFDQDYVEDQDQSSPNQNLQDNQPSPDHQQEAEEDQVHENKPSNKGVALEIGMGEESDTMKERKLKKFEDIKRRKLEQQQERLQRQKSPNTSKSPIAGRKTANSKSPDRPSKVVNQATGNFGGGVAKNNAHPKMQEQEEETKGGEDVPLSALVPAHILKKQKERLDSTPTQHPTPKLTPNHLKKATAAFTKNSNKKIIKNAIVGVCLAGESNKAEREQVLKVLEETEYTYYVIMFRGNLGRQDYRALYGHDGGQHSNGQISGTVVKLHGPSSTPDVLEDKMIEKFFRYESGSKSFKELQGIKGFTLTTDAITLVKSTTNNRVKASVLY